VEFVVDANVARILLGVTTARKTFLGTGCSDEMDVTSQRESGISQCVVTRIAGSC